VSPQKVAVNTWEVLGLFPKTSPTDDVADGTGCKPGNLGRGVCYNSICARDYITHLRVSLTVEKPHRPWDKKRKKALSFEGQGF
jgi:hypothetical protein